MRDNFNLTGWVRNKTLLKENIEESQSFDWKPLPQNGNSKRGNFPVTINNDTAIVYDETNSRPIARFTKDDLKGIQDGGYVGTTLGGYQLNNSDELKQWAMGGDEEMNEDQETWKKMRDQGFESGYEAGYDDGKKGRPNDFTKRIAK
jgi:hypothetical protein